jgi:serine/threonine-protein kinase
MVTQTTPNSAAARKAEHYIGPYRVEGPPLGRGGMATAYRVVAEDGRILAAKQMLPELASRKDMVRRFHQAFEVTREMDHPGIIRFLDLVDSGNSHAIVMELVDGLPLRGLIKRNGPFEPGLACRMAERIGQAVAHCHARGILHRDLKPDNVLVDRSGRVLVTDFGIARLEGVRITRTGTILGSPAYMPPEQLAGKSARHLDERVDVYALGVILYELLEGKDPYRLRRNMDLLEVLARKREQQPRPMHHCKDEELRALVLGCLKPEREDRPPDIGRLAVALDALARSHGNDGSSLLGLVDRTNEKHAAARAQRRQQRLSNARAATMKVQEPEAHEGSLAWGIAALGFAGTLVWLLVRLLT